MHLLHNEEHNVIAGFTPPPPPSAVEISYEVRTHLRRIAPKSCKIMTPPQV